MSIIKTAVLSILRRPGKTAILLLVIAITCSLVSGVVLVERGVQQTNEAAKQELGATVTLNIDYEAIMAEVGADNQGPDISALDISVIEALGNREEVKHYDYSQDTYLSSKDLKSYTLFEQESQFAEAESENAMQGAMDSYFPLRGVNYAPIMAVEEGKLKIVEGRAFTTSEIEQSATVAVVSDQFATLNNVQVGDTITLKNEVYDYSETSFQDSSQITEEPTPTHVQDVNLEIIGIFSLAGNWSEDSDTTPRSAGQMSEREMSRVMIQDEIFNTIYTPIKVVQKEEEFVRSAMKENMGDSYKDYPVAYTPIYTLNSPDDIGSFSEAAQQVLPKYYIAQSSQSIYESMTSPLQTIQKITNTSLIVVLIAALAIMSLVIVLSLRDRRHELGIYSALGRPKAAIVVQILVEVLIVALVGLAIAIVAGIFIGNILSDVIFASQFNASAMSEGSDQMYQLNIYGEQALLMGGAELESVIANHSISMSPVHVLLLLGAGIATVLLSCVLPIVYLLRLKPKKILM